MNIPNINQGSGGISGDYNSGYTLDNPNGINVGFTPTATSASSNRTGSSFTSTTTGGTQAAMPTIGAPPVAPNLTQLNSILGGVQRGDQIKAAMKDYDALFAATQATGFQAATNAGTTYSNRLLQSGINPTASGVVGAQAKLQTYNALDNITQQKSATRLDAINKSQSLQAQIAAQIAQIRQAYSSTLADYNLKAAGLELNLNEFNASQRTNTVNSGRQFTLQEQAQAAQFAQLGLGPDGRTPLAGAGSHRPGTYNPAIPFTPGYLPDQGPIIPATGQTTGVNGQFLTANGNNIIYG